MTNVEHQLTDDRSSCPGCHSERLGGPIDFGPSPVVLNYRFASPEMARSVRVEPVLLRQCARCGLIFNSAFDPKATPYDERYENTQICSGVFKSHLDAVAEQLTCRYALKSGNVVEVGCGKGDFLRLLCGRAGSIGFGYDTSCESEGWNSERTVCLHRRYLGPDDFSDSAALVVCRHVVEHVPDIGRFFELLHSVSTRCGRAPVYIETPDWDWIVHQNAHWDIFYEHCNYFSMDALANIARTAGFEILQHSRVFGEQYQALEIQPVQSGVDDTLSLVEPSAALESAATDLLAAKRSLSSDLHDRYGQQAWAIWGAGAKGVCLANALESCLPAYAIDANPAKHGGFVPGTSIEIISPQDDRLNDLAAVLVVNPNYRDEIEELISDRGLSLSLSTL